MEGRESATRLVGWAWTEASEEVLDAIVGVHGWSMRDGGRFDMDSYEMDGASAARVLRMGRTWMGWRAVWGTRAEVGEDRW
jgi:hypothetical protein